MTRRRGPIQWKAEHDIHQAIAAMIARGGRTPSALAADIHREYLARGWQPPGPTGIAPAKCPNHPSIKPPCPICSRGD